MPFPGHGESHVPGVTRGHSRNVGGDRQAAVDHDLADVPSGVDPDPEVVGGDGIHDLLDSPEVFGDGARDDVPRGIEVNAEVDDASRGEPEHLAPDQGLEALGHAIGPGQVRDLIVESLVDRRESKAGGAQLGDLGRAEVLAAPAHQVPADMRISPLHRGGGLAAQELVAGVESRGGDGGVAAGDQQGAPGRVVAGPGLGDLHEGLELPDHRAGGAGETHAEGDVQAVEDHGGVEDPDEAVGDVRASD